MRPKALAVRWTPQITYVTAVLCIADRSLKSFALAGANARVGDIVSFELFRNHGIAFSIPVADAIFWPLAAVVFIALVVLLFLGTRKKSAAAPFLALIVLGAASNLVDRLLYDATIDYVIFFGRSALNIADGMILAGVVAVFFAARKIPMTRSSV